MNKKIRQLAYLLTLMAFVVMLTNSCKKDDNSDPPNTVRDIDGNLYHTVTIGTQVWMVENLKTTKYRNGDPIPNVTNDLQWNNLSTGAYCDYDNQPDTSKTYGRLYNWYAINDNRNIAPSGWHVPSLSDWTTLINYVGWKQLDGGKLMDTLSKLWSSIITGTTNETGFTALPSGYRKKNYSFVQISNYATWWSSTVYNDYSSYCMDICPDEYNRITLTMDSKEDGKSVRCIKDN